MTDLNQQTDSTSTVAQTDAATPPWRGPINEILYAVRYEQTLTNERAQWVRMRIVDARVLTRGLMTYLEAIEAALAQNGPIDGCVGVPHENLALRHWLFEVWVCLMDSHQPRTAAASAPSASAASIAAATGHPVGCECRRCGQGIPGTRRRQA